MSKPLDQFGVPITSGMSHVCGQGWLHPERAAKLRDDLDRLQRAREKAAFESRFYLIRGAS